MAIDASGPLAGAGTGAAGGAAVGGPWGAAIGGALGLISGLLGNAANKAEQKRNRIFQGQMQGLNMEQQAAQHMSDGEQNAFSTMMNAYSRSLT